MQYEYQIIEVEEDIYTIAGNYLIRVIGNDIVFLSTTRPTYLWDIKYFCYINGNLTLIIFPIQKISNLVHLEKIDMKTKQMNPYMITQQLTPLKMIIILCLRDQSLKRKQEILLSRLIFVKLILTYYTHIIKEKKF